jgi:hypothetical protein
MLSVPKITFRRWYMNAVWVCRVGGMILARKLKYSKETHVIAAIGTTNVVWTGLESDVDLGCEMPASKSPVPWSGVHV